LLLTLREISTVGCENRRKYTKALASTVQNVSVTAVGIYCVTVLCGRGAQISGARSRDLLNVFTVEPNFCGPLL
jgi:hypothetical protein